MTFTAMRPPAGRGNGREVAEFSDAHAASPDHRWELDLPDQPIEVTGDSARLHQVVKELA